MAEAIFKDILIKKNKKKLTIGSAGLSAMVGHNPDAMAIQLMKEKGIDISEYKAKQLDRNIIRKSDLILVMESQHKEMIEKKEPCTKGKVFRLGKWGGFDIPDPYQHERKVFEEVLQQIEKGTLEWTSKIY